MGCGRHTFWWMHRSAQSAQMKIGCMQRRPTIQREGGDRGWYSGSGKMKMVLLDRGARKELIDSCLSFVGAVLVASVRFIFIPRIPCLILYVIPGSKGPILEISKS